MKTKINFWPKADLNGLNQIGKTFYLAEKENASRVLTGIDYLDSLLYGGLRRGSLTVLAGRPGSGVESIPHRIALHVASQANQTVCLFNTNQDSSVSAHLMFRNLAGANYYGCEWAVDQEEMNKLLNAKTFMDTLPVYVASKAGINIRWLEKSLQQAWQHEDLKPDLIIVDSIQGLDEIDRSEDGFYTVMRKLKELALGYNAAVIVTSDLKRNLEKRKNKRPYDLTPFVVPLLSE